jgi:hypothetical protein
MTGKGAFDRWCEWAKKKPAESTMTIPAHFHDAVMRLRPSDRQTQTSTKGAVIIH